MPRRSTNTCHDREMRNAQAEDLEHYVDEAAGIASMIAFALDNGTNPPELVSAWNAIGAQLTELLKRAQNLAH